MKDKRYNIAIAIIIFLIIGIAIGMTLVLRKLPQDSYYSIQQDLKIRGGK